MEIYQFYENNFQIVAITVLLILYMIYYCIFGYFTVRMHGNYDQNKKNMGRTLPPYPNGWYIACKMEEVGNCAVKNIQISGHNITLFRSTGGILYALHSYCSHMGANFGQGGKVVNENCIQCPFHGWIFEGSTGQCVDHDGKVVHSRTIEYGVNFASETCVQDSWIEGEGVATQRRYNVREMNGFIYIWIHVDSTCQPIYSMLDNGQWIGRLSNRGRTIHDIRCHIQDIPENGADIFHFRYIHRYLIGRWRMLEVMWSSQWRRGDDEDVEKMFQHRLEGVRKYKRNIYEKLIRDSADRKFYSVANVDNYLKLPFFGQIFVFNLTIIQMGPGLVNIFLKTHLFEIVFIQYIQTQGRFHQTLFHEMYASKWLPYWLTSIFLYAQGMQVYYDMLVWNAKKMSYKMHYRDNEADEFVRKWRGWFSQNYEGCDVQLKESCDW